jgi:putative ABC transport system permease protein
MVAILSASLKASFDVAITDALKADFTLTTSSFTAYSPQVAAGVRNIPNVAAVAEFRQSGFRVGGKEAFLTAVDPSTVEQVTSLKLSPGATDALARGDVLVFEDVADTNGWTPGDTVPAAFATTGHVPLMVGGTFGENRLVGGDYLVSIATYEKYFTEQLDSFVMVRLTPGANAAATQRAIESVTRRFGNVKVENQAAFRDQQAGFVNQLLGLVTALLTMAILVALFGIANTLGLSVFERTRELGLLRAVGMSRRQVKRMVRWESVIIALFGALLGIAVGIGFGWALQRALASQGVTELSIPVAQLVAYVAVAGVVGVVAAIVPARRAAKLNVLDAISYE